LGVPGVTAEAPRLRGASAAARGAQGATIGVALAIAASTTATAALVKRRVRSSAEAGTLRRRGVAGARLVALGARGGDGSGDAEFLKQVLREIKELVVLEKSEDETLMRLVASMDEVLVEKNEIVVRQGEKDSSMYIVAEGEVVLELTKAESAEPLTRPVTRGGYFGAVEVLGKTPQKVTARAAQRSRLWRIDSNKFDDIIFGGAQPAAEALDEDEDGEGDEGESCSATALREIFIVSDSTAESAKVSVQTALRQFDYCLQKTCGVNRTVVYRFVRTIKEVEEIVGRAGEADALVVFTVMETSLHEALIAACKKQEVEYCDLWGGLLNSLEKKFGAKRSGVTGRKQAVNEEYMKIVKAIEYTRKVDDGVLPNAWAECDIMLVGPSRAGKTPLAFYLAQRGFKVANYPLVPDEEAPPELFKLDQNKCFALTINPEKLRAIRVERMKQFGRSNTQYADLAALKKEVSWIKTFYIRKGPTWPVIDTSDAGVVETASRIMEILDRRKGDSLAAAYVSMD